MRAITALSMATVLIGCVSQSPEEVRRSAYLDCARAQGVPVEGGTIRARTAADLDALDACEAIPR